MEPRTPADTGRGGHSGQQEPPRTAYVLVEVISGRQVETLIPANSVQSL